MQIIADANKTNVTLPFFKMFFDNLAFILPRSLQFLLKSILVFSHKMVFIKNEAALLCVTVCKCARASTWSYNLVYNVFGISFAIKSFSFCGAFFKRILVWERGFFRRQFLVIIHLPYSKYRGVKICFYLCRYQNQNFSLVSHLCRSCSTCVSLVLHSCCSCRTRVARFWRVL